MFLRFYYRLSTVGRSFSGTVLPKASERRSIDYVLVYNEKALQHGSFEKIQTFIDNLEDKGFQLTTTPFSVNDSINFIVIHAPTWVLLYYAEIFGIELGFQTMESRVKPSKPYKCMANELTDPDIRSAVFQRAKESLFWEKPNTVTNAEKSLIIYMVLSRNEFGQESYEFGINKLIKSNVFEAAYPVHDGPHEWTELGPLNDRQLLSKYWSNMNCWYKQQPLDIIERYFGPEVSFYFAWLGFYNKMLIPASALGLFLFTFGILYFRFLFEGKIKEICESDYLLCPRCIVKHCKYEPLKNACTMTRLVYIFDNPAAIGFATLMSVWSTVFLEMWRREEAVLQIRWNLKALESDFSMRPEFKETATHQKVSIITGELEPFMTYKEMCYRYTITFSAILLFLTLMALGIFGIMVYVRTISIILTKTKEDEAITLNVSLVASATGAVMSAVFILIVDFFYDKVALWLTNLENHRTQIDFDNSFTYKSYAIAFVNNYCVIFYIAFFKARFYTYPGDEHMWNRVGGFGMTVCDPAGCIIDLAIQLVIVLSVKNFVMTAKQYILPLFKIFIKTILKKKNKRLELTKQWERDYLLNRTLKYHMMKEYLQMIIQYGFVTFFIAAFPPAPIFALINNLIELRVDAIKLIRSYRRPVAYRIPNLAAWNGILKGVTYIGVATNAFVIAFTNEVVQRVIYKYNIRYDLKGYVKYQLSVFNVSEFPPTFENVANVSVCYYMGNRYPPDHPRKYETTDEFWFILAMKFVAVIIFEHFIMAMTGMVAYIIPDIPFWVKQHVNSERHLYKEIKFKRERDDYLKKFEKRRSVVAETIQG